MHKDVHASEEAAYLVVYIPLVVKCEAVGAVVLIQNVPSGKALAPVRGKPARARTTTRGQVGWKLVAPFPGCTFT